MKYRESEFKLRGEVLTWIKERITESIKPDASGIEDPEAVLAEIMAIIEEYPEEEK